MKKYVLNIEKLYTGSTANALVLEQVDSALPELLPSAPSDDSIVSWWQKCKLSHPEFKSQESEFNRASLLLNNLKLLQDAKDSQGENEEEYANVEARFRKVVAQLVSQVEQINSDVLEFNLSLQQQFKDSGHSELYMLDDTKIHKKLLSDDDKSVGYDKTYLHNLNGRANDSDTLVNSSQLNVLFPVRKLSKKSLYAKTLDVETPNTIDDVLQDEQIVTLCGQVSYEDCIQGIAQAGSNIYLLSPCIEVGSGISDSGRTSYGNGMTVVNGSPEFYPNTMTLFQPSQDQYVKSVSDFIEWYEKHNHRTIVTVNETYGENVSNLQISGLGSYELDLATYGPSRILVGDTTKSLTEDGFRQMRSNKIDSNTDYYLYGKYYVSSGTSGQIGFLFNLYDGFITGNNRVINISIPKNKDVNRLLLKFDWEIVGLDSLPSGQDIEVAIYLGEDKVIETNSGKQDFKSHDSYCKPLTDTVLQSYSLDLTIRIHYSVDFGRRNSETQYASSLQNAGVVIRNIWIDDGSDFSENPTQSLTFGSYVNELGISEEEWNRRYEQFWVVSEYRKNIVYQTVLETSLNNTTTNGISYRNNYSSGDLYGDMFLTKSALGPEYDMSIVSTDELISMKTRKYIGIGSCSSQLYLVYRDAKLKTSSSSDDAISMYECQLEQTSSDGKPNYQMIEVVKNINRFESSIKHKSNVFSVVAQNTNLAPTSDDYTDETKEELSEYGEIKKKMRDSVTQFVRNICNDIVPVHTQLFGVQFT